MTRQFTILVLTIILSRADASLVAKCVRAMTGKAEAYESPSSPVFCALVNVASP
jgi:hypothetical protein